LYNFVQAKESLKGQCQKIHKINYLSSFLKHFHRNNSIYQITTPSNSLQQSEGGNLQTVAAQLFLFKPNSSESEKAWSSLLSIYKFSLGGEMCRQAYRVLTDKATD
jgi:hypothetical protein